MIKTSLQEIAIEENIEQFLLVLLVALSVAILPQIISWFRRIPYTLLLVIVGSGLAVVDVRLVQLSPELILLIFLPPLLFEAAWNLKWSRLKQDLIPICLYAVVGTIIAIAGVAIGLNQLAGLSVTTALLIGASLAATDPVSVTALFRELGVDKRLTTLMEGESLFNEDGGCCFWFCVGVLSGYRQFSDRGNCDPVVAGSGNWAGYWGTNWVWDLLSHPTVRSTFGGAVANSSCDVW